MCTVAPVSLLGLAELSLRSAGYGQSTAYLTERNFDGQAYYMPGKAFFQQFFSLPVDSFTNWDDFEFQIPVRKAENTVRIFVFGSSAANGQPPDAAASFWRMLEVMLTATFPQFTFEVCCVACPMANSNVMWGAARACAGASPDVFLVYMGNNEVSGPFGGSSKISSSPLWRLPLIRANILLTDVRLIQLGSGRSGTLGVNPDDLALFHPNLGSGHPKVTASYGHFERNVEDICALGRRGGASTVLCTVGSNLRHYAPFASIHREGLADEALHRWEEAFQRGVAEEGAGNHAPALAAYTEACGIDDAHAELAFRMGRCHWSLGDFERARACFLDAEARDAHRVRGGARVNAIIERVAGALAGQGVFLADAAGALAAASPHGVPGREMFYDNVHLTAEGNYEVARAAFGGVVQALAARGRIPGTDAAAPSQAECFERLALTPFVLQGHVDAVLQSMGNGSHTATTPAWDENAAWWRQRKAELAGQAGEDGARRTLEAYGAALKARPGDYCLQRRAVQGWQMLGEGTRSLAEAESMVARFPHRRSSQRLLGSLLLQHGRVSEAGEALRRSLASYPDESAAWVTYGWLCQKEGDEQGAVTAFRRACAVNSLDAAAHVELARALGRRHDWKGAVEVLRGAFRLHPDNAELRLALIRALLEAGETGEAVSVASGHGQPLPEDIAARMPK
jgi:tetratricopeptide (TPR) repeat protein